MIRGTDFWPIPIQASTAYQIASCNLMLLKRCWKLLCKTVSSHHWSCVQLRDPLWVQNTPRPRPWWKLLGHGICTSGIRMDHKSSWNHHETIHYNKIRSNSHICGSSFIYHFITHHFIPINSSLLLRCSPALGKHHSNKAERSCHKLVEGGTRNAGSQ